MDEQFEHELDHQDAEDAGNQLAAAKVGAFPRLGETNAPKKIVPPAAGWQKHTWYLVDLACFDTNPVHRALFYSGFLNKGRPGRINDGLVPLNGPDFERCEKVRYLRVVRRLFSEDEAKRYMPPTPDVLGELGRPA